MKKSHIAFLMAAGMSLTPLAFAKDAKTALAEITPGGCPLVQIAPFGTSLLASWDWSGGTDQTKFGGDAEYTVSASLDGGDNWYEFEVEFELVKYEPGTLAEDYPGELVYRCSNAQTDSSGSCNGSVLGLRDAIIEAAVAELVSSPEEIGDNIRATLDGVNVKAMNPGNGNGSQKYPLVDVCEIEII